MKKQPDLSQYTKPILIQLSRQLGVNTVAKDTKLQILEKVEAFMSRQSNALQVLEIALVNIRELAYSKAVDNDDSHQFSDNDCEKACTKSAMDENQDSDDDDEDDDDEDDDNDDDEDYQAGPPINLYLILIDPIIEWYEWAMTKSYELTDAVGITCTEYCHELRENLSTLVFLNFLQLCIEFSVFLYTRLAPTPLKNNPMNLPILRNAWSYLSTSELPSLDVSEWCSFRGVSVVVVWLISAIWAPLIISFFVNFSKRVIIDDDEHTVLGRIYTFDPFVFALAKLVLAFYIQRVPKQLVLVEISTGFLTDFRNYTLILLHSYSLFLEHLGTMPFILGLANIAIALYSQFEDY